MTAGLWVWWSLGALSAAALPCPEPEAARGWFEEALLEAADRRLGRALALYERAHASCPRIPTAFNLASTLQLLGRPVEAHDLFARLEEGAFGALSPEQASAVAALKQRAARQRSRIEVAVRGAPGAEVFVNDAPAPPVADLSSTYWIDPGRQRIRGRSPDGREVTLTATAAAGQTTSLTLVFVPLPSARPPERRVELPDAPPPRPSAWLWVGVGLAAAAVAVGTWVAIDQAGQPAEDPVWGRIGEPR